MTIRARVAVIVIAGGLYACAPASHDPPASSAAVSEAVEAVMEVPALADEAPAIVARKLITPTPEMLKAALSNDPDAMRAAVTTAGTCQAASTCPAEFGACTNWSTPTICNETCGAPYCICRPIRLCGGDPPEPRGTQTFNAFRICFDPQQHACTEWSNTSSSFCGC